MVKCRRVCMQVAPRKYQTWNSFPNLVLLGQSSSECRSRWAAVRRSWSILTSTTGALRKMGIGMVVRSSSSSRCFCRRSRSPTRVNGMHPTSVLVISILPLPSPWPISQPKSPSPFHANDVHPSNIYNRKITSNYPVHIVHSQGKRPR